MPRKNSSQQPPKVMTWGKALPLVILALVFDALRLMFSMFWFFGPALAALYCTIKVGGYVGTVVGGLLCSTGAGVAGFFGFAPLVTFGVIMDMTVGLIGWMTLGLLIIMTNSRIFTDHAGHSVWFLGSLALSEVPFVSALPALTGTVLKMYHNQIKSDAAALQSYNKSQVEERKRVQQQQVAQFAQEQQAQMNQIQDQEAAEDEAEAAEDEQYTAEKEKAA